LSDRVLHIPGGWHQVLLDSRSGFAVQVIDFLDADQVEYDQNAAGPQAAGHDIQSCSFIIEMRKDLVTKDKVRASPGQWG
jgi:hypothetical protein